MDVNIPHFWHNNPPAPGEYAIFAPVPEPRTMRIETPLLNIHSAAVLDTPAALTRCGEFLGTLQVPDSCVAKAYADELTRVLHALYPMGAPFPVLLATMRNIMARHTNIKVLNTPEGGWDSYLEGDGA